MFFFLFFPVKFFLFFFCRMPFTLCTSFRLFEFYCRSLSRSNATHNGQTVQRWRQVKCNFDLITNYRVSVCVAWHWPSFIWPFSFRFSVESVDLGFFHFFCFFFFRFVFSKIAFGDGNRVRRRLWIFPLLHFILFDARLHRMNSDGHLVNTPWMNERKVQSGNIWPEN